MKQISIFYMNETKFIKKNHMNSTTSRREKKKKLCQKSSSFLLGRICQFQSEGTLILNFCNFDDNSCQTTFLRKTKFKPC